MHTCTHAPKPYNVDIHKYIQRKAQVCKEQLQVLVEDDDVHVHARNKAIQCTNMNACIHTYKERKEQLQVLVEDDDEGTSNTSIE